MHKGESVQENETHKTRWEFEIQMDRLIPVTMPINFSVPVKMKENKVTDK